VPRAQALSMRLGLVSREDLASACRKHFPPNVSIFLWVGAEIAITACDLAEVIGSAIAMKLLFGLPVRVAAPALPPPLRCRRHRPFPAPGSALPCADPDSSPVGSFSGVSS
jgi:hypothetical protein